MRTLFVGDVHGCARPLRALVDRARPDAVLLLGDIFAKGPDPRGVWDLIREVGAEGILGNHDARLLDVWGTPGESAHHRAWPLLPDACRAWTQALPIFRAGEGWLAVHAGVHPIEGRAGTTRRMALTMRRWPDDVDPTNPFWWQLYRGEPRVYYGHDALRGVQVHPNSVGLDSGCVYGQRLSGILLETGELYTVDAAV